MISICKAAPASPTARLFSNSVERSRLTQRAIAALAGYPRPNIITVFKTGETRVPLVQIPVLAEILGIDPKRFLRVALEEYDPEVLKVLETHFGPQVSRNEYDIVCEIRKLSNGADHQLRNRAQRDALAAFAKRLVR